MLSQGFSSLRVLDLFAGTGSATKAFEDRGHAVIKVELDESFPADYRDVLALDVSLLGSFDFIWASPPCTTFSVASIGKYWQIIDGMPRPRNAKAMEGLLLVEHTLALIKTFNPRLGFIIENPRGMLRKLPVVQSLPRQTVTYCQYGDNRMKPTDLWGTIPGWTARQPCINGANCHEAAPRGSRTGTQGLKGAKTRSMLPYELGEEICKALERHAV